MEKTGDAIGNLDGHMCWLLRFSLRKSSNLFCSHWSQGVDLGAECLRVRDKFYGMVPLLPVQELINRFFAKNISELLVGIRNYILQAN